jgi:hypothetical protein
MASRQNHVPPDNILSGHAAGRIMRLSPAGAVLARWATEHIYVSSIVVAGNGDIYATHFYWAVHRWMNP